MGDPEIWRRPQYDRKIAPWIVEKEMEFLLGDVTGHCEVMSPYLEHYGIKFGTTDDNAAGLPLQRVTVTRLTTSGRRRAESGC